MPSIRTQIQTEAKMKDSKHSQILLKNKHSQTLLKHGYWITIWSISQRYSLKQLNHTSTEAWASLLSARTLLACSPAIAQESYSYDLWSWKFQFLFYRKKEKEVNSCYLIYTDVEVLMALRCNSNSEASQYATHLLRRQIRTACLKKKTDKEDS